MGAWRRAKTQHEVKITVDADAKAHGEPIAMLAMEWNSFMVQFKAKYGADLCEEDLPAQSFFEDSEELAEGSLEAEHLSEVVSKEEAEAQRKSKPDPACQYGMRLDRRLTLQTRRFARSEPRDIEQIRAKFTVTENMWLLAQLLQPGRAIYSDLTASTITNILKVLLSNRNFNLKKEVDGQVLVQPSWSHCLSYEYHLQKEACKRCRTRSMDIAAALQSSCEDNEHRTQHWVQLVTMANSAEGTDFGQSRFGHPDLTNFGQSIFGHCGFGLANLGQIQFWPIQFWPIQFWPIHFWIWCVSWPIGWGPNPEKIGPRRVGPRRVGPRRVGGPKFRVFIPSPTTSFALFLSHCVSSRGFLVVFGSAGAVKCARLEFSGCCVKPRRPRSRRGFTPQPESPNVHI